MERFAVGSVAKTNIVLMFIHGVVDERLVKEVRNRLSSIEAFRFSLNPTSMGTQGDASKRQIAPTLSSRLGLLRCTPSMGVISRVKVPNGGWRTPTVSQEQGCPPRGGI
ncbi:spore germination protein [Paenibacillus mucilaginosus]|uniref:spore germination protein n=1 Tax=Paenibacillus mucilaginosus TaxID=61624 RepID=UPI003D1C4F16